MSVTAKRFVQCYGFSNRQQRTQQLVPSHPSELASEKKIGGGGGGGGGRSDDNLRHFYIVVPPLPGSVDVHTASTVA